jgi:uncharacterized protein YeaC (DUF1315 family)
MDLQKIIQSITPEVYQNIKSAVELGKWPNGVKLTKEQQQHSLQILIAYDAANAPYEQRVGFLPPKNNKILSSTTTDQKDSGYKKNTRQTIKWKD